MADLDPRFTFENFVVGPANRLASAAARRAAEDPGASYNPLFLYSASGLGKTHILGAIARHVEKLHQGKSVTYQTLEAFLGELAEALAGGDRDGVRGKYSGLDILLMDDVQFLTGQPEAQEMLLRTLDALTGAGKQVVLASDRPPAAIDGLDARLRSRFEGGLLVDIGPPEYETRVAIVRKQADARGQALDPDVAEVIGRIPFTNIRELGGALNRILAIQELEDRKISPEEASALLGEQLPRAPEQTGGMEVGSFLDELTDTVAAQVERQEAPWRRELREVAEEVEARDFRADKLRRLMEAEQAPADVAGEIESFRQVIQKLDGIRNELNAVGNPWPEAAHGVLRDPERLDEAQALLASAKERARPFPSTGEGEDLDGLAGSLPQLVVKAAEQLVGTDRPEYNPLYVWSADGSVAEGLLRGAGRSFQTENPDALVACISVDEFAEDFIGALSSGVAGAWRERWWAADLLLVHGAEALSETERAQDEFFHLFEALQRRKARIMVAADRPPSRIRTIDDRLRSRFEGGLVLEVEQAPPPTPEASSPGPPPPSGGGEEKIVPPLDEFILDDSGRAGLYPPEPPPGPPQAGPVPGDGAGGAPAAPAAATTAREEAGPEKPTGSKKDVSALDREWILGFTAESDEEAPEADDVPQQAQSGTPEADPWYPSPETVVWIWPRFDERVVEDPD